MVIENSEVHSPPKVTYPLKNNWFRFISSWKRSFLKGHSSIFGGVKCGLKHGASVEVPWSSPRRNEETIKASRDGEDGRWPWEEEEDDEDDDDEGSWNEFSIFFLEDGIKASQKAPFFVFFGDFWGYLAK